MAAEFVIGVLDSDNVIAVCVLLPSADKSIQRIVFINVGGCSLGH